MLTAYQVWEGDLYLYTVHTEDEANEAEEAGFNVVAEEPQEDMSPFETFNS